MASKGQPLGIGLAIDFSQLDSELAKVTDRIEKVGKNATLKVGTLGGMSAKDPLRIEEMAHQVSQVGANLAQGMTAGMGVSNALLLSFAAKINALMDQMASMMSTMFNRLDVALKGHRWTNMLTGLSQSLGNWADGAGKKLTPLDKALGGAFGQNAKVGAAVFNTMFENLAKKMTTEMTKAAKSITALFGKEGPAKALGDSMIAALDAIKEAVTKLSYTMSTTLLHVIDSITVKMRGMGDQTKVNLAHLGAAITSAQYLKDREKYAGEKKRAKPAIVDVETHLKPPTKAEVDRLAKGISETASAGLQSVFFEKNFKKLPKQPRIPGPTVRPEEKLGYGLGGAGTAISASFKDAIRDVKLFGQHLAAFRPTPKTEPPKFSFSPGFMGGLGATLREAVRNAMKLQTPAHGGETIELKEAGRGFTATLKDAARQVMDFGKHIADFKVPVPPAPAELAAPKARILPPRVPLEPEPKLEVTKFQGILSVITGVHQKMMKAGLEATKFKASFAAAIESGNEFAIAVGLIGQAFYEVGSAAKFTITFVAQALARIASAGLAVAAFIGRSISFITTLGSVGKKSFSELVSGHNIFVSALLVSTKLVYHLVRGLWDLVTLKAFRRVATDAGTATSAIGKLTGSVARLGTELAAAFGVVGVLYKVIQFFKGGVKSAADLNAEVARSKVVFGASFGAVEEQVAKTTKEFKISKVAQLEVANAFGSMAQGAGVSEEKSAALAQQLTALAVDTTGLGISFAEASEAMKTGLSGRAISLKQFSVNIDENTTKAFAWAKGIARTGSELTNQQELMARAGMIMRGLSYAQGALAANAGQAAVQFQKAGGGIAVFAEKMGEMLLPAVQEGISGFNELLSAVLAATEGSTESLASWGKSIKDAFSVLGVAVRNAGDLWKIAQLRVNDFVTNALAYLFTLPENLSRIWKWLGNNWQTLLGDMIIAAAAFGTNLATNFMNLGKAIWEYLKGGDFTFEWTPLLKGAEFASEKLPELIKPALVSSQKEIDKLYEKIGANEQKLKEQAAKPITGEKEGPLPEAEKKGEYKLGGALEVGSKEAFSAISKGMTGKSSTTDAVKQGVAVQKDIHKAIKEQTQVVKDQAKRPLFEVK